MVETGIFRPGNTARIDNGPPKSLKYSQKRRDIMAKNRSKSARSNYPELNNANIRSTATARLVDIPLGYEDFNPPRSSTQNRFVNNLRCSYDPLDYHEHYFTSPNKPFTPRINSYTEATSSALRHYKDVYDYEPAIAKSESAHKSTVKRDSGDQMKSPSFVPRLDFEGGGGNENEVAVTASARTHEYNYRTWVEKSERRRVERDNKQRLNAQSDSILEEVRHSHDNEINKKNEEMAYLEFVREVTADIIRRNISTNSVIKQAFEWHIEQNKGTLDEARMRDHLTVVSRDLGLMDS